MPLAKRDEGSKVNSTINVTPMVDVMLVLLIIFMVVTPMLQKGINVSLAKTDNPHPMESADKEDAVLVAVLHDGTIFLGTEKMASADQLTNKVKDRLERAKDKTVFIRADARAKYGAVAEVVDNIRAAGVDQLGLLTEQRKAGVPAAPGR